jgi:hypothetical protein
MKNLNRCDNCFFSIWAMSPNRPVLLCMQRPNLVGRWQVVLLEQSCDNFYPSAICKEGSAAVRRIPLTRGKFALVDTADYYQLSQYNWTTQSSGNTFYACRKVAGKVIKMHRFIMSAPADLVVDHIDHNGLNNCRSNLRLCTPAQNARNTFPNKGTSSRYKGVHKSKGAKKWCAAIKLNNKTDHLGTFENQIAAAMAYDEKAGEFFGEYAHLNFPQEAENFSS